MTQRVKQFSLKGLNASEAKSCNCISLTLSWCLWIFNFYIFDLEKKNRSCRSDVYDLVLPTLFSVAANVFRNVFITLFMCFDVFLTFKMFFIQLPFSFVIIPHVLNSRYEFVHVMQYHTVPPPKKVTLGVGFFTISQVFRE